VIPFDLPPKAACNELANGGEEVRSAVNCFEFESWSSGSSMAASCAAVKKKQGMIVTKGSFVNRCLKKLLGLCRIGLGRVRCYLGRLIGLGFKPQKIFDQGWQQEAHSPAQTSLQVVGSGVQAHFQVFSSAQRSWAWSSGSGRSSRSRR